MPMHSPAHPGRLVRASLEELDVSVARAADAMRVNRSQLHRVINGTSALSPEMALRLERVLGGKANHWLAMQSAYDLARIRNSGDDPTRELRRLDAA